VVFAVVFYAKAVTFERKIVSQAHPIGEFTHQVSKFRALALMR
jgi:hypothetical protein